MVLIMIFTCIFGLIDFIAVVYFIYRLSQKGEVDAPQQSKDQYDDTSYSDGKQTFLYKLTHPGVSSFVIWILVRMVFCVLYLTVNFGDSFDIPLYFFLFLVGLCPLIGEAILIGFWHYIIIAVIMQPFLNFTQYIIVIILYVITIVLVIVFCCELIFKAEPKKVSKNTAIASAIILIMIVVGCTFSGFHFTHPKDELIPSQDVSRNVAGTNTVPETTEKKSLVELFQLSSPVNPGDITEITVKGEPYKKYSIKVYYSSGQSDAEGLTPKIADDLGYVSWTWKVGTRTTPGTYSIYIYDFYDFDNYDVFHFDVI